MLKLLVQSFENKEKNKKAAFRRLVETKKFKEWHRRKVAEVSMDKREMERRIERAVDEAMKPENIKIEYGPFKE